MTIVSRLINEIYHEHGPEQHVGVYAKALREKVADLDDSTSEVIEAGAWIAYTRPLLRRHVHAYTVGKSHYKQLSAFSVEEYRALIVLHVRQSGVCTARAYEVAEACQTQHGLWINPATVLDDDAPVG